VTTTPPATLPTPRQKLLIPRPLQVYELLGEWQTGQQGRYEEIFRKLVEAQKMEPIIGAAVRAARITSKWRDFPQAIQLFTGRTLELNPKFAPPQYYLGVMYAQTFKQRSRDGAFQEALELEREFRGGVGRGSTYLRLKRVDEAASDFKKI